MDEVNRAIGHVYSAGEMAITVLSTASELLLLLEKAKLLPRERIEVVQHDAE